MKKKILSVLLAAIMVIGMLPAVAFADGEWNEWEAFGTGKGTYAYNLITESEISKTVDVYVRTSKNNEKVKQLKIEGWGKDVYTTNGVDLIINWNENTDEITIPEQDIGVDLGYGENTMIQDYKSKTGAEVPCTYDPTTGTFNLAVCYYISMGNFGSGYETLTMDIAHTHGMGTTETTDDVTFATEIKTLDDLTALFTNGGNGYLTANITCTESLTVTANTNLCLNDKVLNLAGKGNIIVSNGKTFSLYDCGTTVRYYDKNATTGLWTLNDAKSSGDYTTAGGIITGGKATNGGCVNVKNGTFTMNGGTIVGNTATLSSGATGTAGGVYIAASGTFTMNGGNICGNAAKSHGGGVFVTKGSFIMTGGKISENKAGDDNFGGGVYITESGKFTMTGGLISQNTAGKNGGGVHTNTSAENPVIGGKAQINGNTLNDGITVSNLNLNDGTGSKYIVFSEDAPIESEMYIGVTLGGIGARTGQFTTTGKTEDVKYFFSDRPIYEVKYNSGNYLELVIKPPHIHDTGVDTITFDKAIVTFADLKNLFASGGNGYLAADITATAAMTVSNNVSLCLNGHVIAQTASASVIKVPDGATLNLYDCDETEHYGHIDSTTQLWVADSVKQQTDNISVFGGYITGGRADNGGGIYNKGTFIMNGGNIVGNTAANSESPTGGGVYNKGTFIMNGGTITGNVAEKSGGGVWGNLTLNDGEIIYNTATDNIAGGVRAENKLIMKNGKISHNSAIKAGEGDAGGVYAPNIEMYGGEISYNTAAENGGGIYVAKNGLMNIAGGEISYNTAKNNGGGIAVNGENSVLIMNDGNIIGNKSVKDGSNGCGGGVYVNTSATFTMAGGTITGNKAMKASGSGGNGAGVYVNGGKFSMSGNSVISENSGYQGAGVYSNSGTFTMSGNSKITKNSGTIASGVIADSGSFTMSGNSMISYNEGTVFGGGVQVTNDAVFNMSENSKIAYNKGQKGGGVYVVKGIFNMFGGSIDHNTATNNGGGVYADANATVTLGGTAVIKENTIGDETVIVNNVYLPTDKYITIGTKTDTANGNGIAAPTSDFSVGVTTQSAPTYSTAVKFTTNGTADDAKLFNSDNTAYEVKFNTDHLEFAIEKYNIILQSDGHADPLAYLNDTDSVTTAKPGDSITLHYDNIESGYEFDKFEIISGTVVFDEIGNTFIMPEENVTIRMTFKKTQGSCVYNKTVCLTENGAYGLNLGCCDKGEFSFAKVDGGWSISNADGKFLAMQDGKLALSDEAFAWTYKNGAFSTSVKSEQKTCGHWILFIYIPGSAKTVTTTYYLSTVTDGDKLSTCLTCAELYETVSGDHEFGCYMICKDGTHKRICKNCGEVEIEEHCYDNDTHKCVCGKFDPSCITVDVTATYASKTQKQFSGFLFWGKWKNVTTYTATVNAEAIGVKVAKVEVAASEKGIWVIGNTFTSDTEIDKFYVRITTNDGKKRLFMVNGGIGYPAN